MLGDRERGPGARQTIRRIARAAIHRAQHRRDRLLRDARGPTKLAALPSVARVVPNDDKPQLVPLHRLRMAVTTAERFGDWRRRLRRAARAGRRRPDGVHAARADRLRRAVLLLHHSDDPRRPRSVPIAEVLS